MAEMGLKSLEFQLMDRFSEMRKNRLGFAIGMTALLLSSGGVFAGGSLEDHLARFSTPGPDRYADGSIVADGECYALVWSPKGTTFAGFNADGTPVSADHRVVLAGAIASGGRCPDTIFQIPAAEYEALKDGEWALCLVDTRTTDGVPTGVYAGKPFRVNRWGSLNGGITIESGSVAGRQLTACVSLPAASGSGASLRAKTLSAVPPTAKQPTITAIEVADEAVWLAVSDTEPYLSYTIISGTEPTDLKADYFSDTVDGKANSEIAIGTAQSAKRRFFKVKRAE